MGTIPIPQGATIGEPEVIPIPKGASIGKPGKKKDAVKTLKPAEAPFVAQGLANTDIPGELAQNFEETYAAKPGDELITQGIKFLGRNLGTALQGAVLAPVDEFTKESGRLHVENENLPLLQRAVANAAIPFQAGATAAKRLFIDPQVQLAEEADQLDQQAMIAKAQGDRKGAHNLAVAASNKRALSIIPFVGPSIAHAAEKIGKAVDEGNPQGVFGAALDLGAESAMTAAGAQAPKAASTASRLKADRARAKATKAYTDAMLEFATEQGKNFDLNAALRVAAEKPVENLIDTANSIRKGLEERKAAKTAQEAAKSPEESFIERNPPPKEVDANTAALENLIEPKKPDPEIRISDAELADALGGAEVVGYNAKDGKPIVRFRDTQPEAPKPAENITKPAMEDSVQNVQTPKVEPEVSRVGEQPVFAQGDQPAVAPKVAERVQQFNEMYGLPPVPKGHVRLWRGEKSGLRQAQGRWFTDDPMMADRYAGGYEKTGSLHYVDVPAEKANALKGRTGKDYGELYGGDGGFEYRVEDPNYFGKTTLIREAQPQPTFTTGDQPALRGDIVSRQEAFDVAAGFTADGLRSRFGIPEHISVRDLEQRGIVKQNPEGLWEINGRDGLTALEAGAERVATAKAPRFTTGDQPGANYTSEQLQAFKAKHGIKDEPRQMVGEAQSAAQANVEKLAAAKDQQVQAFVDAKRGFKNKERGAVDPDLLLGLPVEALGKVAETAAGGKGVIAASGSKSRDIPKDAGKSGTPIQADIKNVATNLSRLEETLLAQTPEVKETGTFQPKELRPDLAHQGGTKTVPISEKTVEQMKAQFVKTGEELQAVRKLAESEADHATVAMVRAAEERFKTAAKDFNKARASWGRTGKVFQRGVIESLATEARELGVYVGSIKAKAKDPLLVRAVEQWREIRQEGATLNRVLNLGDMGLEYLRQNVYTATSFTLDAFTNAVHFAKEAPGILAGDLAAGNFHGTRGMLRAIIDRKVSPEAKRQLGSTAAGERFEPLGISKAFGLKGAKARVGDVVEAGITLPLRLKTLADSFSKNTWYNANLYTSAFEEAGKRGLSGIARDRFVNEFVANPPEWAFNKAVAEGNRGGFNVPLSDFEARVAGNRLVQMGIDPFLRWGFQFSRWMGDAVGINPGLYKRIKSGEATPREVTRYFTSVATGIGGIYLVDSMLYDGVDFQTMEYRHENGDRTRLSSLSPIPEALYLSALIKGDQEKAKAALKYVSVPFVKGLNRGLLSDLMDTADDVFSGKINEEQFRREMDKTLTTAIPGQALFRAIFGMFDNTRREGVLGLGRPIPKATTGAPDRPRQKLFGVDIPVLGGTPIPGARRVIDPVESLLLDHGVATYRPRRTPIAEFEDDDVPKELRLEFEERAGKLLNQKVTNLAKSDKFNNGNYEMRRRMLLSAKTAAAKDAKEEIAKGRGFLGKLPRKPSVREQLRPTYQQKGSQ